MCKNDDSYKLTELEIVLPIEVNGEIVETEMDLYAKAVVVDGMPFLGYYVIPAGNKVVEVEPVAIDLNDYELYKHSTESFYVKDEIGYKQQFKFTITRNGKDFLKSEAYDNRNLCEQTLHHHLQQLSLSNRVDFRKKNFKEQLVGKTFKINNVDLTVLEYFDGLNNIRVKGKEKETILPAWAVNT